MKKLLIRLFAKIGVKKYGKLINQKLKDMFKSKETTIAGILAFLSLVSTQVGFLFDTLPETNPDWGLIVSGLLVLIGLGRARDNNKTSKEAGAES